MTPNFALSALYALDNLDVMRGMDSESVRLIYADPPFNSRRMYQGVSGSKARAHRFRDTWSWNDAKEEWLDLLDNDYPDLRRLIDVAKAHSGGMGGYLAFMAPRIIEMHRILTPDGSLYLHCDPHANSYLRLLLDMVFGANNFRNEIIWKRHTSIHGSFQHDPKQWGTITDTILFYAKTTRTPVRPYLELAEKESSAKFNLIDENGRRYYDDSNHIWNSPNMGARPNQCYEWRGYQNPYPSGWRLVKERLEEEYRKGNIVILPNGKLQRRKYESDFRGTPVGNYWGDINPALSRQRTGWNTQKPVALLERIIKASSNEGDIVFDPFCGCGTALVAAESLGRRWVGADDDANAIDVVRERVASLKGAVADNPQLQAAVDVLYRPPERTVVAEPDDGGVLKDPTGYIIPKMPSDKMSNAAIREQLLEWQGNSAGIILCPGCGELLKARHFHVDHIDPKSTGGSNRIDNRILLCGACNSEKSDGKTLAALWRDHGIGGKQRRDMQERVKAIRDKARAYVQELDSGWRRNDG